MKQVRRLPAPCLSMLAVGLVVGLLLLIFILEELPYQPTWLSLTNWLGVSAAVGLVLLSRPFVRRLPKLADGLSLAALLLFIGIVAVNLLWLAVAVFEFIGDLL